MIRLVKKPVICTTVIENPSSHLIPTATHLLLLLAFSRNAGKNFPAEHCLNLTTPLTGMRLTWTSNRERKILTRTTSFFRNSGSLAGPMLMILPSAGDRISRLVKAGMVLCGFRKKNARVPIAMVNSTAPQSNILEFPMATPHHKVTDTAVISNNAGAHSLAIANLSGKCDAIFE